MRTTLTVTAGSLMSQIVNSQTLQTGAIQQGGVNSGAGGVKIDRQTYIDGYS